MWFTVLGAGTMYGYLLHGFVIKASRFWGWYDIEWLHTPLGELAVTAAAVAVITVLCTAPGAAGVPLCGGADAWSGRSGAPGPRSKEP